MTDIDLSALPQAQIARRRYIAPIWLLPLLALLIGVWLLWRSLLDTGPQIDIEFDSGDGIVANQTVLRYRGINVGLVKSLRVKKDLSGVVAHVELDKQVENNWPGVPKNTQFWLVQPQITLSGVSGLGTLFSGNYIAVDLPARVQKYQYATYFVALQTAPPMPVSVPGLHIKCKTGTLGSISVGAPVFSRQIQIGSVNATAMAPDGSGVVIDMHIEPKYQHLVRKNTRFWNASGLRIDAGLSGLHVETESLTSLLAGGISMSNADKKAPASQNGDSFILYDNFDAADASVFINVQFSSASGLSKGATQVRYKGIAVGKLFDTWYDDKKDVVMGRFGIDPRFEFFISDKTRFWLVRPQLSAAGVSGLDALLTGSYLTFAPSPHGTLVRDHTFTAFSGPDPSDYREPGLHLRMQMPVQGGVGIGAPLYYRQFVVGSVLDSTLLRSGIESHVLIWPEYQHLVNASSRFWNSSGVRLSANLTDGIQMQAAPLASLVAGGISFDTPREKDKKPLKNGHAFTLYADENQAKAVAADSKPGLYLTLESADAGRIAGGAPILYRSLPVGVVQSLGYSSDGKQVQIRAYIEPSKARLLSSASRFWRTSAVEVKAGAGGFSVSTGSLPNLMLGGIAFEQFEDKNAQKLPVQRVHGDTRFRLYASRAEAENAGINVRLKLNSAQDLSTGSEIRYRGLVIGEISRLQLRDDLHGVIADATLKPSAERLLTSGSGFWIVSPKIGLSGASNLNTLLGSYLALQPGAGKAQREFTVGEQEPRLTTRETGLNLQLTSTRMGSLKTGDPVLYRQVKVGEVISGDLNAHGTGVQIYINLWPQYAYLARANSRFWTASGVRVKAGLFSGVKVTTESLETIIAGGIAFSTENTAAKPAVAGQVFTLFETEEQRR